ncbi:MAG: C40 family peptidase [Elusimicrobia bacterium]|nr:C40 family peptidase [Elusimicrobiota bacterium]
MIKISLWAAIISLSALPIFAQDDGAARPVPRDQANLEETQRRRDEARRQAEEEARRQRARQHYESVTGTPHPSSPRYYDHLVNGGSSSQSRPNPSPSPAGPIPSPSSRNSGSSPGPGTSLAPRTPVISPNLLRRPTLEPSLRQQIDVLDAERNRALQRGEEERIQRERERINRLLRNPAVPAPGDRANRRPAARSRSGSGSAGQPAPRIDEETIRNISEGVAREAQMRQRMERSRIQSLPATPPPSPRGNSRSKADTASTQEAIEKASQPARISSERARAIRDLTVRSAQAFRGQPYGWNGCALKSAPGGLDCSGFAYQILFGRQPTGKKRNADGYFQEARRLNAVLADGEMPQPGDIFFRENSGSINHIGFIQDCRRTGAHTMECTVIHANGTPRIRTHDGRELTTYEETREYRRNHHVSSDMEIEGKCAPSVTFDEISCTIQQEQNPWTFTFQNGQWHRIIQPRTGPRRTEPHHFADSLRMRGLEEGR